MSAERIEKRSIPRWILLIVIYLCFVAELSLFIMDFTSYGILFAGLCFCLLIVFFVLWREEYAHKLLTLQGRLDDALRQERQQNRRKEHEQLKCLRKEKEELACENAQAQSLLKTLSQEKEMLAQQLAEIRIQETEASAHRAAESILPPDEQAAELDLAAVFSDVAARMEDLCKKSGIRLCLSSSAEKLIYRADERYIRLIAENIIDNSIKFMRKKGSLVITLSHMGNHIFLAFKDDGMGLPQKEAESVFDLNMQGSNRAGGTGLGLSQVRAVVHRYGGSVYARSTDGMGIYIQLPVSGEAEDGRHRINEEEAGEMTGEGSGQSENTICGE